MIYFIQETGLFRNRVKIGFTADSFKGRLAGLRGGSPSRLKVLLALPGDKQVEGIYHERFAKYRLHGEWFKFGLRLRLFVWMNQFKPFVLDDKFFILDESKEEIDILGDELISQTIKNQEDETTLKLAIEKQVCTYYLETRKFKKTFGFLYELENGRPYTKDIGGGQTAKVKAILDRHNIAYPDYKRDKTNE